LVTLPELDLPSGCCKYFWRFISKITLKGPIKDEIIKKKDSHITKSSEFRLIQNKGRRFYSGTNEK
jgi:hypothetical protein